MSPASEWDIVSFVMFSIRSKIRMHVRNPVMWSLVMVLLVGNLHGLSPMAVTSYHNVIAFVCDDGHDEEICVVNADGSGFAQLTHNSNNDSHPSINRHGQIAYGCEFESDLGLHQQEICTINIDGSGARRLTQTQYAKSHPQINDQGWIAYQCINRGESICRAHVDREVEANFPGQAIYGRFPALNNNNEIVYACRDNPTSSFNEICLIDIEGRARRILSDMQLPIISLDLNDAGQIVFECALSLSLDIEAREICAMTTSGFDMRPLTQNQYLDGLPSINNDGRIVFECDIRRSSTEKICSVNFDGSGYRPITNNNFDDSQAVINSDGFVVHICRERDSELCVVHVDGSGFRQLTGNVTYESEPVIN